MMSSSRFQNFQNGFFQSYQQAEKWYAENVSPTLNSKPILFLRGTVHGAVKAAFGVNYLFDLGLSVIPATSPWYNSLKILKYTITSITFVVSTGTAYYQRKQEASKEDLVKELETQFDQIDKALTEAEEMLKEEEQLLHRLGYQSSDLPVEALGPPIEEPQPELKTPCDQCEETIAYRAAKALFKGAVDGTGIQYIVNQAGALASSTPSGAYIVLGKIASWGTFLGSGLRSYSQGPADLRLKERIARIHARLVVANQKTKVIEQMLGSRSRLIKEVEYGSKVTHQRVWFETDGSPEPPNGVSNNRSRLSTCIHSSLFKKASSLTDGAYMAGSVHNMLELLIPSLTALHYLSATITVAAGSKQSYNEGQKKDFFAEQIQSLNSQIKEMNGILDPARKVMAQQRAYVSELLQGKTVEQQALSSDPLATSESQLSQSAELEANNLLDKAFTLLGRNEEELKSMEEGRAGPSKLPSSPKGKLFGNSSQKPSDKQPLLASRFQSYGV